MSSVPKEFYVTPYYIDKEANAADKAKLQSDTWMAYDLAWKASRMNQGGVVRETLVRQVENIILDWALNCSGVGNDEARLVMTYKAQLFIEAYLLLDHDEWNSGVFLPWVDTVYWPCAETESWSANNHGAWGILGTVLSGIALKKSLYVAHRCILREHVEQAVGPGGVMVHEVERYKGGIWYSYFALAPYLRAAQLLGAADVIQTLMEPLQWLFYYCQWPQDWPWMQPPWWKRFLWKVFPGLKNCPDELWVPKPNDWGGNLYRAAGMQYGHQGWLDWAGVPPFTGVNIYRAGQ